MFGRREPRDSNNINFKLKRKIIRNTDSFSGGNLHPATLKRPYNEWKSPNGQLSWVAGYVIVRT